MITFTIPGEPATKKTSAPVATDPRTGRRFPVPSKRTREWTAQAKPFMRRAMRGRPPLLGHVAVDYVFWRCIDLADLGGLEAALDDAMQGIVYRNDRQIRRRTSVLRIDKGNPRVEVTVVALEAQQTELATG